jgi:hypothetical protein
LLQMLLALFLMTYLGGAERVNGFETTAVRN